MQIVHRIAMLLVIVGALNWGLVGLAGVDLVAALFGLSFGQMSGATAALYALVGLAGIVHAGVGLLGIRDQAAPLPLGRRAH